MDEVWKAIEAIGSLLAGIAAVIAAVKSKGNEPPPAPKPKPAAHTAKASPVVQEPQIPNSPSIRSCGSLSPD